MVNIALLITCIFSILICTVQHVLKLSIIHFNRDSNIYIAVFYRQQSELLKCVKLG